MDANERVNALSDETIRETLIRIVASVEGSGHAGFVPGILNVWSLLPKGKTPRDYASAEPYLRRVIAKASDELFSLRDRITMHGPNTTSDSIHDIALSLQASKHGPV